MSESQDQTARIAALEEEVANLRTALVETLDILEGLANRATGRPGFIMPSTNEFTVMDVQQIRNRLRQ